jgi:hypothetical protein
MRYTKELYESLCEELDAMLIDSGVRDICIQCSTVGIPERIKLGKTHLGCCSQPTCKYLGENGCTSISIACKSWFCYPMKDAFRGLLDEAGHLKRFDQIINIVYGNTRWGFNRRTVNELFPVEIGETINEI